MFCHVLLHACPRSQSTSTFSAPSGDRILSPTIKLIKNSTLALHSPFQQRVRRENEIMAAAAGGGGGNPALEADREAPAEGHLELAQFAAGCFWGVELAFQRVEGVAKTEVGYSQGHLPDPTYRAVCGGDTGHAEVVRIHFDPAVCPYSALLALFWSRHNPTTLNRQGNDVGTQYRSGIYYYNEEQARLAKVSLEAKQEEFKNKIVTEILPAKQFYRAEEYHQQYLEKGGGMGEKQSARKGCNDPIRCYG